MMKNMMSNEKYAAQLGIHEKINHFFNVNAGNLARFIRTAEYQKYRDDMERNVEKREG
ncbi:hypothetical protein GQ600_23754 [Phytophthora cactorum]|nr:hypothetical protein GQ600_23754 [Phytophthora cactorum]